VYTIGGGDADVDGTKEKTKEIKILLVREASNSVDLARPAEQWYPVYQWESTPGRVRG